MKEQLKYIGQQIYYLMLMLLIIALIVQYLQIKADHDMIQHLQGEIQAAQDVTIRVMDKYTQVTK
jgi:hypothetical protein